MRIKPVHRKYIVALLIILLFLLSLLLPVKANILG